jgi:hypothetical protein
MQICAKYAQIKFYEVFKVLKSELLNEPRFGTGRICSTKQGTQEYSVFACGDIDVNCGFKRLTLY